MAASVTGAQAWKGGAEAFGRTLRSAGQGISTNIRFPGQYFDGETGAHYSYFRDYDPSTGRYVECDPIGIEGGINRYVYAESSPLLGFDSNGLKGSLAACAAQCAADQLGLTDLVVATGVRTTLPLIPKEFVTGGATGFTSLWSETIGDKGRMPLFRGNRSWPAPTYKNIFARTAKVGRFFGRWIPISGTAFLVYDAIMIALCTKGCLDHTCEQ